MKQTKNTILLIDDDYAGFIGGVALAAKSFKLNVIGFETIEKGIIIIN